MTREAGVASLFLLSLVVLSRFVISASHDRGAQRDLTLATLTSETSKAVNRKSDTVARVARATWPSASGAVSTDTIELNVSRGMIPSAKRGGFLADQASSFNRTRRRQAWISALSSNEASSSGELSGLLVIGGIVDGIGSREITVDPGALVVPSPFAERAWGTVLAHDSRRYEGLIRSQDVIMSVPQDRVPRPDVRGAGWCVGVARPPTSQSDVYCGSLAGMEIGRNAELSLNIGANDRSGQFAKVTKSSGHRLWKNGAEVNSGSQPVRAGDVLFTRRTGSLVVSQVVSGVVAGMSSVNGQRRFVVVEGPLRTLAIALAHGEPAQQDVDTTVLALHVVFTRELDSATSAFLRTHKDVERAEVVVLDGWTGGVRALAGRAQSGLLGYVPGFEPGFLGSLVKPILATAILSEQPALQSLVVESKGEMVSDVQGIHIARPFAAGHSGRIDLATFLEISSNKYAVELLFSSLLRSAGGSEFVDKQGNVSLGLLERSGLAIGLMKVFDVQVAGDKSGGRDESVWRVADSSADILPAMQRQSWYAPWASRPLLFRSRTFRSSSVDSLRGATPTTLSRFAYGQSYNEWTLLGAAQAIGRVVTGRAVSARMLDRAIRDSSSAFEWRNSTWSTEIRKGMRGVVRTGTAAGLDEAFNKTFGARSITVYGKTGTAQKDNRDNRPDRNALGLFIAPSHAGVTAPDCGLAVALAVDYQDGRPEGARAHRDFAAEVIAPLTAKHWDELVTCRP